MSLSARPLPITTHDKTTNIYGWSLSAPTVGAVRGEDAVCSTLFGHRMAHFSTTLTVVGSGDTICFSSLEFPDSHQLGCRLHPSLSHPRPSSSEAWTSSPTGSAYYTSVRRLTSRHPSEGRPPSTPGHTTSTTRHLRFISSKLSAQTPL